MPRRCRFAFCTHCTLPTSPASLLLSPSPAPYLSPACSMCSAFHYIRAATAHGARFVSGAACLPCLPACCRAWHDACARRFCYCIPTGTLYMCLLFACHAFCRARRFCARLRSCRFFGLLCSPNVLSLLPLISILACVCLLYYRFPSTFYYLQGFTMGLDDVCDGMGDGGQTGMIG